MPLVPLDDAPAAVVVLDMMAPFGATTLVVVEPSALTTVVVVSMPLVALLPADPVPDAAETVRPVEDGWRNTTDAPAPTKPTALMTTPFCRLTRQ
jgi:hypothetical protein